MLTAVANAAALLTSATASTLSAGPAGEALRHVGPWGFGGGLGWLFLLVPLFWIAVIVLIASLAARRRRRFWEANGGRPTPWGAGPGWGPGWAGAGWGGGASGGFGSPTADAEKTLAERFARGDIDEIEYRARLEVLQAGRPAGPFAPTKG